MKCTINDLNLSFDKEGRLRKTIMRVSKTDSNKATALAGFLVNADFKKFLLENITDDDVLQGETISFNLFTNNDYVKINQNKLGSLLADFYNNTYLSVDNSKTIKGMGRLDGFTSAAAKTVAKNYTATLLIDEYRKELVKHPKARRKPLEIIADVSNKITDTFYDRIDDFVKYILSKENYSSKAKEMARQYIDLVNQLNEINSLNAKDNDLIRSRQALKIELENKIKQYIEIAKTAKLNKNVKEFQKAIKNIEDTKKTLTNLHEEVNKIKKAKQERNGAYVSRDRYALAHNLVTLFANNYDDKQGIKLRNYANLVIQSRANADSWYFQVFNTKNMTSVIKEFNKVEDIEEYIENQDENNDNIDSKYNEHNIDETTKSWEDNLYRTFNQTISGKLRMILSTIPKLSDKFNPNDNVQAIDTENELGVQTYMDAQYLTVQIYSFGDFSSVKSLIDSIDKKSQTIKSLYGLGQLVYMMKSNKAFANYLYANFAKPIANKTMLIVSDIANEDGIRFDYSNPNSFPLAELSFRMINKIRSTYNSTYDANDINVLGDIYKKFNSTKNKEVLASELFKVVNKYFPNFNKDVFNNYFDNMPDDKILDSVNKVIRSLQTVIRGVSALKKSINDATLELDADYKARRQKYTEDLKAYNSLSPTERKKATKPEYPQPRYIDYTGFDLNKQIYSGIIGFSEEIVNYTDSRAQLNAVNAEGNSSSNVLKNCFITRFFDQIMTESEEDSNAGLKNLGDYITQGTDAQTENQYSNNPLFFGVKDENGIIIVPGMFTKTATGYDINPNAKEILKHNLFDGTKNTQDDKSSVYASMSKIDFFITQYMAFRDSTSEMTKEGKIKNIGNTDSAVYSMRIGSDAPKIFFIRAPRYNHNQVQYAIYGHVMDELNMFIKGLNGLFVQEGETVIDGKSQLILKTRTDVDNLISRAFYDEKTADELKQKGNTDMTSAIIKDGKLRGNLFKFLRLFEVNGYNAGADIEAMLSLYGELDTGSLFSLDKDGRLRLTPNSTIVYNPSTSKFELNLNQEQKAQLKQIVRNWTQNFLIESKSRSAGFVKVLKDNNIPFDERTLDDFLLNSVNMNMNYDDLFEGDYKYYKNARDFLKRTKESQAGGDGYAGFDITEKFDPSIKDLVWYGNPEAIQIDSNQKDENGNPLREQIVINGKPLVAKNGFRGVTIYNTVKASDYADDLQKELESIFIKQGMRADDAHERSVKIASGYGFAGGETTKINDAQSYITLEEFIRRKWADGTIEDYADLIKQLLDDTPAEEINLDEINARIQVQKNFYFDKVFDSYTGLFYPRQIKNAEFVLIPKLLPKDSELRKVHDWMQEHNIGQLNTAETSKAAKKNIFTIWNAETGEFNENFADSFDESYVENYYYQYLYKQQDVPQHMMDEHNKAGVQIMKKIIDNIINEEDADNPKRKQLVQWADEFQSAYTANIKEDFHLFLNSMGWIYNAENGTIENENYATTDSEGNPLPQETIEFNKTHLNFNNFYTRAREEAARLGMDSNFMEYLIPDEFGNPAMPNFMNIVRNKLESVAQSLYNNKITRQVLPGWHAAQITGVGYSKRLKFDPKTGIMEVYLPRWNKLIPKTKNAEEEAELIKQIEEEGLDIHIGYRIPTEGKQSISVLKVVGFTNDALGSTIIVPDEWVTQTGSDFDVDSVYGICWEMYDTKDKKTNKVSLHKIPFEENTVDEQNLYMSYVRDNLDSKIKRTEIGAAIETSIKEIRDRLNFVNERGELNEKYKEIDSKRNELFDKLPGGAKSEVINIDREAKRKVKNNKSKVDIRDTYPKIISALNKYLEKHNVKEEKAAIVKEYVDYLTAILDIMNTQDGLPTFDKKAYSSEKAEAIRAIVKKAKEDQFTRYEAAAKEANLLSFEEWSKRPFVERLDRRARNNYIIDRMIKIMNDETSREEQYGRSNFDKITNGKTGANDVIDKISGKNKRPISPYNPLDQLDYFEDAMGGARLKALSVNWDTFVSKNNKIRAFLSNEDAVQVIIENGIEDSNITYNIDEIKRSYAEDVSEEESKDNTEDSTVEETNQKRLVLTARRLGWSRTNRNMVGDLVTTYTSQTTAHHLDAVKMGSVPNVDEFTFSTYKFLSSLGIDFENVIAFMRQPVITNLVANNNLIKSTFVNSSNKPIKMTLVDIANRLGLRNGKFDITYNTSEYKILDAIKTNSSFVQAFNILFGIDISKMDNKDILNIKLPLDKKRMFTRIKRDAQHKGDIFENAAFDFGMLLTFRNIQRTAEKINQYIIATAADKYGAKPSGHETRKMTDSIEKLRNDYTLSKDGKSFIELIFPSNGENSEYGSINAVYNFTTKPSIYTLGQLFVTESPNFVTTEKIISGIIHHNFTESEYKEYMRYAISYLYNQNEKLLTPLTVDNKGRIMPNTEMINQSDTELKTANDYWNAERSRICGYGVSVDGDFEIKNINKPTKEEIDKFNKLTPAQKVLFIQRHFPDNQGIFNYIKVTLLNNTDVKYKGISRQYLSYDDQVDNIEELLYLFVNSFSNKNPLIKLAAIDLIKYAFIAEGFNYKFGYISKLITNEALYKSIEEGGLYIIDKLKSDINDLAYMMRSEEFIDNYVRSHSDIVPIKRLYALPKKVFNADALEMVYSRYNESTQFLASMRADKLVHIDATVDNPLVANLVSTLDLFRYEGGYIKVAFPINENTSTTILYKVEGRNEILDSKGKVIAYKDYFLVPLNPLDKYETYEYSYNKNYNTFNSKEYYDNAIDEIAKQMTSARDELFEIYSAKEQTEENNKKYATELRGIRGKVNRNIPSVVMPIGGYKGMEMNLGENQDGLMQLYDNGDDFTKGGVQKLIDGITTHVRDNGNDFNIPYVQFNPNLSLKRLIPVGTAVTQNVVMEDGSTINVTIAHHRITEKFGRDINRMMVGEQEAGVYEEAIRELNNTQTLIRKADIYRVTKTKEDPQKVKDNALKAATDLIVDSDKPVSERQRKTPRRGKIDNVSSAIIREISYEARKNNTPRANAFVHELDRLHVSRNMGSSLVENRENIYKSAARYYRSIASEILNKLDKFSMLDKDGNPASYSMDDPEMYEALAANDEYFKEVADVILKGITFGNRIIDILKLDLSSEDVETKRAIEEIIANINEVRQNKKLASAMNNIINIYFKKYSTNPEIVRGILELRETFGDLDKIDALIADPTDIDNNEVQVILKQVYTMFSKAEMFDAERNVKEWKDRMAEIDAMAGSINMDNIIDSNAGMIRQEYNSQFLEDKQKVIDDANIAFANRNNSLEDFEKYVRAKYARDKFMYENTEQPAVADYYKRDLELREEAMRKCGSIYFKYLQLSQERYSNDDGKDDTDENTANRKQQIISAMNQLRSEVNVDGSEKSEEDKAKARALNKYIKERRELLEKYFESQEYDGFKEDYTRYKKYIDKYNATHPEDTLEQKLANDAKYREAYNWIKSNGQVKFGKEESLKLSQHFQSLTGRTNVIKNKIIAQLKTIEGAIDESGMINPMKLTDAQIAQIREEEMSDLSKMYDSSYTEGVLIKDVPQNIPLMKSRPQSKNDNDIYGELKYEDNAAKHEIITEINKILSRCVDKYSGRIDVATLFNNDIVSDEERVKLASLYKQLRNLRQETMKRYKKRKNRAYTDATNDVAFLSAMNYYRTNLQNTKQAKQFLDIFTEIDDKGNVVANSYIYGYRIPTEDYIDHEKTDAIKYIRENVDFVTNEYYDIAMRQAQEQGEEAYNKWFRLNHVYDPYNHRWQPLKIWTKLEAKPGTDLHKSIEYVPYFNNMEHTIKQEFVNPKYKRFSNNYKKGNKKYDSNIRLNPKEEALRDLYIQTLNKYATTYQGKRFVGQGYLPRERKNEINARWAFSQVGALLGFSWHSGSDSDTFYKQIDYSHDREAEMNMLNLLKTKGYKKYKPLPIKGVMTDEEYAKAVAKVREENRQIRKENEKLDNAILNRNWNEVMEDFIHNATIFNSRQAAKPYLYLLLEDLAVNNAYMLKGIWGKRLIKDDDSSTDDNTTFMTVPQTRTRELVHNLARRLLFSQYHENSNARRVANVLQNLTSAKYMVFNLYGGIANITTGKANIAMEEFANEYFGFKEFAAAEKEYLLNSPGIVASLYSDKARSLTGALIKRFNVVDFDQLLQFGAGSENLEEQLKRVRSWMYSFQSVGEHYMQNSVLLAMLKSNRLYTDNDGVQRIGDFKDFTWDIERKAMEEILKDNEILLTNYRTYVEGMKDAIKLKYEISTNRKDLNRNFLYSLRDSNNKDIQELYRKTAEKYHKKRNELMKNAKEEFNKQPTVESLFTFKDGKAVLSKDAIANFNAKGKNPIGDLEHLIAGFRKKVIAVNDKIHGVYNKDGAAQIESTWWGSILMQYHKHLYNGIFKRWRKKGFYSEFRGSRERGSYITFMDFLGTEFTNFKERIKNKQEDGENIVLASLQVAMKSVLNSFTNIVFNWNNLSDWERANIRRNLGDMGGMLVAALVVMALYGLYDDDEIKDDIFKSSLLYLADRLYSDSSMYSPMGLVSEYKTAWSSPIASANGPSDLLKAMQMIPQAMFDPDFNPNYQTGQYAGQNKFSVLIRRNMPGVRPLDRIRFITKNNKYYKVGESQIGVNIAKNFGESLHE